MRKKRKTRKTEIKYRYIFFLHKYLNATIKKVVIDKLYTKGKEKQNKKQKQKDEYDFVEFI